MPQSQMYKVNPARRDEQADVPEDDPELTMCGLGSWRPQWMQFFAKPIFFLINMSLVGMVQSMTGPLFFSSMSTLEKRYAFDSRVSGAILIADNFSQLLISPVIGYFAVRYNRSRLIAIGEMFLSFSCFLCATPYFIYGSADHFLSDLSLVSSLNKTSNLEMCGAKPVMSEESCLSDSRGTTVWTAVILLFVGSFFRGIGFTCYFVIGFPYMDDNVSKKNSPMYLSVIQAFRLFGPAAGYVLSAFSLRFYENPFVDPGISRKDPRFVGAWWMSFCIVGTLLFICAVPMLFFPAQFKNASVKASNMKKKMKQSGGSVQALKRFVTNPIVMLYMTGSIFRYLGLGGYIMFKTKYIESQYRQSSSSASLITGTTTIMPMAIGILLGGAMISIFRPSTRFIFIYVFLVESVSIFTLGSGIFLGCNPIQMQGKLDSMGKFSLGASCNQNCTCTTQIFKPLCDPDGQTTYFSPCHAGCNTYDNFNRTYQDCSCFTGGASSGFCQNDIDSCQNLYKYLMVVLSGAIVSSTARTANSLISFRSVDPMDKGFTMGAASSMMAIFAFIPYPLIFGSIADSVCLVWESRCGKTGNCWLYDQEKFRFYLHGAVVSFMVIGSVFDFIMIFFSNKITNFYDDAEAEQIEEKKTELSDLSDKNHNKTFQIIKNSKT